MPIETTTTIPNWTSLEGRLLDGGYEIGACVLSGPAAASFEVRVLGDRFTIAFVNVFAAGTTSSEQFRLWEEALELKNPQLSSPLAVSRLELDGVELPYVILRKADERLSGVLRERALTVDEGRELLRSALEGLEYLHARGFVHTCISPEEVLAIGDSIQLSTTSIRPINSSSPDPEADAAVYIAPEANGENTTTAADIWCLGATLYETLTQKRCAGDCEEQAGSLAAPYNIIVARCLDPDPQTRCTLDDLRAMLRGERLHPPAKKAPPATVLEETAAAVAEESTPAAELEREAEVQDAEADEPTVVTVEAAPLTAAIPETVVTPVLAAQQEPELSEAAASADGAVAAAASAAAAAPGPAHTISPSAPRPSAVSGPRSADFPRPRLAPRSKPVYTEQRLRHPQLVEEEAKDARPRKMWLYALIVLILAMVISWLIWPKTAKSHAEDTSAVDSAQTPASPARTPNATVPGSQSHVLGPDTGGTSSTSPAPSAPAPKAATAAGQNTHGDIWHVVVYTFAKQEDAEKQAQALNQKHPGFNAQVFSSTGAAPYLVVVGGNLTHEEAVRIRQRARSSGLPRDAYIQNFDH